MPNFDDANLGQGATGSDTTSTPATEAANTADAATDITAAATDLHTLIDTLCPDGVEWKTVGEVAEVKTGSSNGNEADEYGVYPFFVRSKTPKHKNTWEYDEEAIIIPGEGGVGDIYHYVNGKYALHQRVYRVHFTDNRISTKFEYYYFFSNFKNYILQSAVKATVISIRKPMVENFRIPVPPLAVQEKIVQILNKFTELAKELAKEQQARRAQYEYYRDWLLDLAHPEGKQGKVWDLLRTLCPNGVEWKTLGEYCEILDTKRKPIAKSKRISGDYPYYGANGIQDYVNDYLLDGTYLLVAEDGSVLTPSGNPVVNWATGRIWVNNHAHILHKSDITQLRYLYYYMQTINISQLIHGNIPKLTGGDLRNIKVPVPPLAVQAEIVRILDQFSTLAEDIATGLPAEIAARQTQYEYYRNQLLSFKGR